MAHVQEMLAGRYEVLDVLGRGGMAVVYRGRDRTLMRTVAIKVPAVDRTDDPSFVAKVRARSARGRSVESSEHRRHL